MKSLKLSAFLVALAIASPAAADESRPLWYPSIACSDAPCATEFTCWTVSVTYRVNIAPPQVEAPPVYVTRQIEFLNEPGNAWDSREAAECHARKAMLEGIERPLNWPDNTEREFIPPSMIEGVKVWWMRPPQVGASAGVR